MASAEMKNGSLTHYPAVSKCSKILDGMQIFNLVIYLVDKRILTAALWEVAWDKVNVLSLKSLPSK
jgi:hypothetical protein